MTCAAASPVSDVTPDWDDLVVRLRAWPYQTRLWGAIVTDVFGGTFRVLRVHIKEPLYVPVLIGGRLGGTGFCCGHIGYGGVVSGRSGLAVPVTAHLQALSEVEQFLGLRCGRLVTAPNVAAYHTGAERRETILVPLALTAEQRWLGYAGSVRTAVRKCRRVGVQVAEIRPEQLSLAHELIQQTQLDTGSRYLVPSRLIELISSSGRKFGQLLGCWFEGELIAVGVFLRAAGRAVYLFNGWDRRQAGISPNYLLVHEALNRCADLGDHVMDMGYSHKLGLRTFKDRWGGRAATVLVIDNPLAD